MATEPSSLAEHWKDEPEEHDYPAAENYLSLLVAPSEARRLVAKLQAAPLRRFAPKDVLRASGLALLSPEDLEVAADLAKIRHGTKLSPVLLIRGQPLWVADGYHRVCASYHINPKAEIPCRITGRN
jgi:hypothetical protein